MDPKKRALVQEVIEVYEKELADLTQALKEYAAKAQRKALVEGLVLNLKQSIGNDGRVERTPIPRDDNEPMWKGIRTILTDLKRPASAPEITRELAARGWKMTKNAREIVRSVMLRKADVFQKVGPGLYGLKEATTTDKK